RQRAGARPSRSTRIIVENHELWAMLAGPAQLLHWLADCERRLNSRGLFHLKYIPPARGLATAGIIQGWGHGTAIFLPQFPSIIWLTRRSAGSLGGLSAIWYASSRGALNFSAMRRIKA